LAKAKKGQQIQCDHEWAGGDADVLDARPAGRKCSMDAGTAIIDAERISASGALLRHV
jgi:hypothetical protein